jgi:hypothetical protein
LQGEELKPRGPKTKENKIYFTLIKKNVLALQVVQNLACKLSFSSTIMWLPSVYDKGDLWDTYGLSMVTFPKKWIWLEAMRGVASSLSFVVVIVEKFVDGFRQLLPLLALVASFLFRRSSFSSPLNF